MSRAVGRVAVVTGASRGFGRAVALALARVWNGDVDFILTARDAAGLSQTRSQVLTQDPTAAVTTIALDMGRPEVMADAVRQLVDAVRPEVKSIVLLNNAGSLGPLQRLAELTDPQIMQQYMVMAHYCFIDALTAVKQGKNV